MNQEVDKLLKGTGGGIAAPQILFRGRFIEERIRGLLDAYCKMYPNEVNAIGQYCKFARDNAEWRGQFSRAIFNSKDKEYAVEGKVPMRLAQAMSLLFHANWMDDKQIMDPFWKMWGVIGAVRQIPKPDVTRHLGAS
jgi:hypothetical protein